MRKKYSHTWYIKHREYKLEQNRLWREKNRAKVNSRTRQLNQELKEQVLMYYGKGKLECVLCHYNNKDALSIDHINGNGAKHRRSLKTYSIGSLFYRWLKRNNFPKGFRTLCMNCQFIERAKRYDKKFPKVK
jgi:hypothetical protein